jgi:hypothetical protein
MIRYALACGSGHEFESWFASADAFDDLDRRGLNACPVCGSSKVAKRLMAPAVSTARGKAARDAAAAAQPALPTAAAAGPAGEVAVIDERDVKLRAMLRDLHAHVRANTEDVGKAFAEKAFLMHQGEIEHRPIRGQATPEEAAALREEGVPVAPLPPLPDDLN